MVSAELLVIDDEREMLVSYEKILSREGYRVQTFESAEDALNRLSESSRCSMAICDLNMPGMDGMEFLSAVKKRHPSVPVIMVSGYGTLDAAIEAVKLGALDFVEKPFSRQRLLQVVNKAGAQLAPAANGREREGLGGIIGQHPAMRRLFDLIPKIAVGDANVLITGESGVGKELIARSVHRCSDRRGRPIVPINCGALPEPLFESELFGHQRGAFTGADETKPGLIELANGGVLFLDEVCELPHALQVKLLRVLETRKIRPVGGKKESSVDIRLVSATNRDVDALVSSGGLRSDFFYRINTIHLHVPALRERAEDIPLLALHFLRQFDRKYGRGIEGFEAAAVEAMQDYRWPGNVRELQNVVERTYYLAAPPVIKRQDLPTFLTASRREPRVENWMQLPYHDAKDHALQAFEREYLCVYLDKYDWNISQTASACGLDRRTLHRLINRYGLRRGARDGQQAGNAWPSQTASGSAARGGTGYHPNGVRYS